MSLSVAIVGLSNVGKSTLFNALLKKQQAYVANFPFATIEPNIGIVPVPDGRLEQLRKVVESEILGYRDTKILSGDKKPPSIEYRVSSIPIVPATVEFVDIAGLIAGASKGEGLGNKFLSHIRETNAICFVLRAFTDPDIVKQGVKDPVSDFEVLNTELALADLQTLEKQKDPGNTPDKELKDRWQAVQRLKTILSSDTSLYNDVSEEERKIAKELGLLTIKPVLVVMNVDEKDLANAHDLEISFAEKLKLNPDQVVAICAKTESELAELSNDDQKIYMEDLGIKKSGLERLIQKAFKTLGLITFLTAGEKEVRAWTIPVGISAQEAAGVIHTDFIKKFIKADVCDFSDFIGGPASPKPGVGGWKVCREEGKVRSEGRDYIMHDGDVVEFKIGS
ncbi:MAG: GTP-binding protein YchF [Candidatus Woesebacteria bacterium GW2011_GWB1_39_10]|uniref:GTP-binding protein YchF n=2 Tax=Candidatus Woeseibacteriota TaxID=1752722 RepID=A0A0G0UYA0_9BACT|nr:MAG: GTP-binding protein YchF [Candidatus Woesebacteria bacterium GW2011_GWB1_39_10]KKR92516.1 MAG: GTP-binding protein YchF [Candidatus Woesebacteria bacterium GW2011_GWA1_41_13b]